MNANVSENEEIVVRELSNVIVCLSNCDKYLREMDGKISTEILDLIDDINKWSVKY